MLREVRLSQRDRIAAALFGVALLLTIIIAATRAVPFPARSLLYDFRAFDCAGAVAGDRADPYRAEPLRRCEHTIGGFRPELAKLVVPAPLPGYALIPFAVLGRFPFPLAAAFWTAISLLGLTAAGFALGRMSRLPARIVWSALALSAGFLAISLGQLVPLALGALCIAALALERGRYATAAVAAWIAMIEPHVALPAVLALAIFAPRARIPLGIGLAIAIVASIALLGFEANLEYLRAVLPAHAASELTNEEQYSLAYILHGLRLPDVIALSVANLSYLFVAAAGILVAQRIVARGAPRSLLVLVPAAFAVIGGPFVHVHQMAFVIPAALVLAGSVARGTRALGLALLLLAIPWGTFLQLLSLLPLVALGVALLAHDVLRARPVFAALAGVLAAALVVGLAHGLIGRPDPSAALRAVADGRLLAEASWTAYIRTSFHSNVMLFALAKLPTFAGLALFLAVALRAAFAQRRSGTASA
jgi:hypothetical protein